MTAGNGTISKQAYNDALEDRLWMYMDLEKGSWMMDRIGPGKQGNGYGVFGRTI
ncbi:MAG: hypothetical protein WBM17_07015 [Anaerolineales bacterium]